MEIDNQTPPLTLLVKSKTWSRDSHGLYDYECSNVSANAHLITSNCHLVRRDSYIQALDSSSSYQGSSLLAVHSKNGRYSISSTDPDNLWLVIKHLSTPGCILNEGDVFKMGRVMMHVKEIFTGDSDTTEASEDDIVPSERGQCRVCLCEENEEGNPLITPCACIGSVKYIHLECLQRWLDSRKVVREGENSVDFYWKSVDCELCKAAYPFSVQTGKRGYQLLKDSKLSSPYIVLEMLNREGNNSVHVISLINKQSVKLGRGHDSDIRIPDISVSRVHGHLYFKEGCFYFEDNNSKFGSLLLVKDELLLNPEQPMHVQVGRSVFSMKVGEKFESIDEH